MGTIITTSTDLRNWTLDHAIAAGGTAADAASLAEAIQADEHPAWGSDWMGYLDEIDVVASMASGAIVRAS